MCRLHCCHCLSHQVMSSGRWAVCALALVYAERLRRDLHKIKAAHKLQKIDLNSPDISAWRRVREGVCLHLNNYRARVDNISQIRTVYDPDWVGNWRRGQHVASNMEQYIEAMRLRAGRQQVEARVQVVSEARAASQQRSSSSPVSRITNSIVDRSQHVQITSFNSRYSPSPPA